MPETVHLHWAWAVKSSQGGPVALRGLTLGISACNTKSLPRAALTAFVDDTTCPRCLEIAERFASQPPKPPRMPRERLIKKELKP